MFILNYKSSTKVAKFIPFGKLILFTDELMAICFEIKSVCMGKESHYQQEFFNLRFVSKNEKPFLFKYPGKINDVSFKRKSPISGHEMGLSSLT